MLNIENGFKTVGINRNKSYKLNYSIYGNGEIKVVFFIGFLMAGDYFMKITEKFITNDTSVLLIDLNGLGKSEFSFFTNIKDIALDVIELIELLNWNNLNVIGMSMGCLFAYEIGQLKPTLIKTMNLTSPLPSIPFGFYNNNGAFRYLLLPFYTFLYGIKQSELYCNLLLSHSFLQVQINDNGETNRELIQPLMNQLFENTLKSTPTLIMLSHSLSMLKYNFKSFSSCNNIQFKTRPFPIVIFQGTNDLITGIDTMNKINQIIKPNLIYNCIDAGHGLFFEDTNEYVLKSKQFINTYGSCNDNKDGANTTTHELELPFNSKKKNNNIPLFIDINTPFLKLIYIKITSYFNCKVKLIKIK